MKTTKKILTLICVCAVLLSCEKESPTPSTNTNNNNNNNTPAADASIDVSVGVTSLADDQDCQNDKMVILYLESDDDTKTYSEPFIGTDGLLSETIDKEFEGLAAGTYTLTVNYKKIGGQTFNKGDYTIIVSESQATNGTVIPKIVTLGTDDICY